MSSVAQKAPQKASGLKSSDSVLAVEFTVDTVKFAAGVCSALRKEIFAAASTKVSGIPEEDIPRALRGAYDALRVRQREVTLVIPSHLVITKNIEVPSRDLHEIREIINLQAGRHTPYARDEIIIDYLDIGSYRQNYSKILLVIIARGVLKKQTDMLDKAGLKTGRVVVSSEAAAWAFSHLLKTDTHDIPCAAVHVDEQASDFIVVARGRSIFIRSVSIGASHLNADREKTGRRFAEELRRSLEAYQSEDIERKPISLVLAGAVEGMNDLCGVIGNVVGIPVKAVAWQKYISLAEEAGKIISDKKQISFLGPAAALFAGHDLTLDLSPEDVRLRREIERRGKELMSAGILIMIIFVLGVSIFGVTLFAKSMYLRNVENTYGKVSAQVQELETDFGKIGLIRNYFLYQGYALDVLAELHRATHEDMQFSDIRFDAEQKKLSVRGTAETMSSVFSFSESMEVSPYFRDVETKNTVKRKEGDREVTDFEIACVLERG